MKIGPPSAGGRHDELTVTLRRMNASRAKFQRLLECSAICLFTLLAVWSVWRLAIAAESRFFPVLLVAAPLGWLASDLLSGLFCIGRSTPGAA